MTTPLLVTSCPECGTVFRVVEDQLRLRQGLVRCGVCSKVFDANHALQEMEPPVLHETEEVDLDTPDLEEWQAELENKRIARVAQENASSSVVETPDSECISDNDYAEAEPDAELTTSSLELTEAERIEPSFSEGVAHKSLNSVMPEFLQERGSNRLLSTQKYGLYVALLCVLSLMLFVQVLWWFREPIVGKIPAVRPVVMMFCQSAECYQRWPRYLDALTIESSSLLPHGVPASVATTSHFEASLEPQLYSLQLELRNRFNGPQNWPSIEISLVDKQDQVLARRIVSASEYKAVQKHRFMQANYAYSVTIPLRVSTPAIDGYRVAIFYP